MKIGESSNLVELENVFKALSFQRRLSIMELLLKRGWLSVGEISESLHIPMTTASRNLAVLVKAGLISYRNKSTYVFYGIRIADSSIKILVVLGLIKYVIDEPDKKDYGQDLVSAIVSGNQKKILEILTGI